MALKGFWDDRAGVGYELPASWYNSDREFLSAIEDAADDHDNVLGFLHCFSMRGNIRLMRALIDLGVDINMKNDWGETALFCACSSGYTAMVQLLLEKGADPSQQTKEGITLLHFLSAFTDTYIQDIANLLVRHNAPLEARATSEASVYHTSLDCPYGIIPGCLTPSPEEWVLLVLIAVRLSDMAMFQTLMKYEQIEQVSRDIWSKVFGNGAARDEVAFLEPFKTCLDPASGYTDYLEKALILERN
ncbi:hypothetical protein N0V90_005986 [Kalmusia sp. IMI 367209]|nr:hypothetical protein N0V90_005986 [Kalmusia sp. IMI 367209]